MVFETTGEVHLGWKLFSEYCIFFNNADGDVYINSDVKSGAFVSADVSTIYGLDNHLCRLLEFRYCYHEHCYFDTKGFISEYEQDNYCSRKHLQCICIKLV